MITIEQLKDVKTRTEALYRYLDIENKKIQVEEEQLRTQAPGFWDDAKAAEEQMKKVKGLQKWIDGYKEVKTLCDELELAFDFYKEEMVTEEEVDGLYSRTVDALEAVSYTHLRLCACPCSIIISRRAKIRFIRPSWMQSYMEKRLTNGPGLCSCVTIS